MNVVNHLGRRVHSHAGCVIIGFMCEKRPVACAHPKLARQARQDDGPSEHVRTVGDLTILNHDLLGFFCSRRCPGSVIIKAYDLAVALRDAGVPVVGGFHAPMPPGSYSSSRGNSAAVSVV